MEKFKARKQRLKYMNTTYYGFDKLPEAFIALFEGKNLGKMIVEV